MINDAGKHEVKNSLNGSPDTIPQALASESRCTRGAEFQRLATNPAVLETEN